MSSAAASPPSPRQVVPDRKTPYVLGVLNIVFGALMSGLAILSVAMLVVSWFFNPFIQSLGTAPLEQAREERAKTVSQIDDLLRKASETEDETQRADLEREAESLRNKLGPELPDITKIMREAQDDKMVAYVLPVFENSTSLILNGLLIYSGVGLVRMRESARKLALWLAGLKIGRLLILLMLQLTFTVPLQLKMQHEMQKSMQQQMNQRQGPQAQTAKQVQEVMFTVMTAALFAWFVGFTLMASVYPVVTFVLLTRQRVKLAFQTAAEGPALAPT